MVTTQFLQSWKLLSFQSFFGYLKLGSPLNHRLKLKKMEELEISSLFLSET